VLSGFYNAAQRASSVAGGSTLKDHRILFYGAGSAGIGVAKQLMSFFKLQGLSEEEARDRIWTVDSKGLIYNGRAAVTDHKTCELVFLIFGGNRSRLSFVSLL